MKVLLSSKLNYLIQYIATLDRELEIAAKYHMEMFFKYV